MSRRPPEPAPAALSGGIPDIADGSYDVFIVDAAEVGGPGQDQMSLSMTILVGEHKGAVVDLTAVGLGWSSIDLIGMPGTLTVTNGNPSLTIDT